jgi:hypothetical protein
MEMNELLGLLKGAAPALATAVMGPMGGMAMNAIAGKLGVEATPSAVTQALKDNPDLALKLREIDAKEYEVEQTNLTDRLKADMASDSWLSKNIRPMVLIFLLFSYSGFAVASIFGYETRGAYVELLGQWGMLVMSFYFGGRTLEKLADKVKK